MSETGIQKNVGNLEALISYCKSYKEKYKPSNPNITLAALEKLHETIKDKVIGEIKAKKKVQAVGNERAAAFRGLPVFATQIMNGLISSGADEAKIADANEHNRKIQGSAAGQNKEDQEEENPADAEPKVAASAEGDAGDRKGSRSTSQQSFDNKIIHFTKLIETIETEPKYQPNEPEYSLNALTEKLQLMNDANKVAKDATAEWSQMLIDRNKCFNDDETGLVHLGLLVKTHVKYIYKSRSQEYKHISKLKFVKIKER